MFCHFTTLCMKGLKAILDYKVYDSNWFVLANIKLEFLKITISAMSRDFCRNFNRLKELFMWYCPLKFETVLKQILGFKSYDTYCMHFWKISNWSGCRLEFQWVMWVQLKHSYSDWFFCFLWSKLVLKLGYSQSRVLKRRYILTVPFANIKLKRLQVTVLKQSHDLIKTTIFFKRKFLLFVQMYFQNSLNGSWILRPMIHATGIYV